MEMQLIVSMHYRFVNVNAFLKTYIDNSDIDFCTITITNCKHLTPSKKIDLTLRWNLHIKQQLP